MRKNCKKRYESVRARVVHERWTHRILAPFCALLAHPPRADTGTDEPDNAADAGGGGSRLAERARQDAKGERLESVERRSDAGGIRLEERQVESEEERKRVPKRDRAVSVCRETG